MFRARIAAPFAGLSAMNFAGRIPELVSEEFAEPIELLHELFWGTAERCGSNIALRLAAEDPRAQILGELSYAELRLASSAFARHLCGLGIRRGDRVLLCLPRGFEQYIAILGILEAGAAYVPVDWSSPDARASVVARRAAAAIIVTMASRRGAFKSAGMPLIAIDRVDGLFEANNIAPFMPVNDRATPDDLAYVIFTSGSSGRPKGVMIQHRNVSFQVRAEAAILGVTASDIVYAGASLAFDVSVEEMWASFSVGATLLVGSETGPRAGSDLAAMLTAERVSVWCPVPSLLATIDDPLPTIRLLNVGGEACPPELARRWATGSRRMLNTYGPTETTVTATWTELSAHTPVTIGKPLPGFQTWIVDRSLNPVADGESGELLIGGPGVGKGYWRQDGLTQKKFVTPPFASGCCGEERAYRSGDLVRRNSDGDIEFLGRIDQQVKIRGFRVELGEIESVLSSDAAVAQAVVKHFADADGMDLLVAFVVARTHETVDEGGLRALAARRLPAYMRPQHYELREALPLLTSGKVNRRALSRPSGVANAFRTLKRPTDAIEHKLLAIWQEILQQDSICVTDDFFEDLGGHSLRAARMVSVARTQGEFAAISLNDVYAAPTIRDLAARLTQQNQKVRRETEFAAVSQLRRAFCVAVQTLALVPIFGFAGMQWMLPYVVYIALSAQASLHPSVPIVAAGATFALLPVFMALVAIALKWIVIGRFRAGEYPLWGAYYLRWWFVRRILSVVPIHFLRGTPWMGVYYRMLGAKIGADAFIDTGGIDAFDLVTIGANAILSTKSLLATVAVEHGVLRIGTCEIADGAFVGVESVVGRNAKIGECAVLEDLSALAAGEAIASGEIWAGSPARCTGEDLKANAPPRAGVIRRVSASIALLMATPLLAFAALIPLTPGLVLLFKPDWFPFLPHSGVSEIVLVSPALALLYVVGMCALTVAVKWVVLGKVRPGTHSIWSWFYVRYWLVRQLGELALEILHPLYATLYLRPWFRALGAHIGPRAEISTATSIVHDLVHVGPESFIADGVMLGTPRVEAGAIRLAPTFIGRRSFIGNAAVLPAGSAVADGALIGVLSTAPCTGIVEPNSTWFGSPAIRLPRREIATAFAETTRFQPGAWLVAQRLLMEYLRATLPLTIFISAFICLLNVMSWLSRLPHGPAWLLVLFSPLYMTFVLCVGALVVAAKWIIAGRYRPTVAPLWSMFVWRNELVTAFYENLSVPLVLEPLRGTPFINIYLRLLGCRIGKRVFTDTTDITEFDLISVGDDSALNEHAGLQTHLFEDRVMKVGPVRVGDRATVGSLSIALYDSFISDDAQLGDLSVLMKGESLPPSTVWEGCPARPAAAHG